MAIDAIALDKRDNVATAVQDLAAGAEALVRLERDILRVRLQENISYGHKFAIRPIHAEEDILKYGQVIGRATANIQAGGHAHVQNIESLRGRGDLRQGV